MNFDQPCMLSERACYSLQSLVAELPPEVRAALAQPLSNFQSSEEAFAALGAAMDSAAKRHPASPAQEFLGVLLAARQRGCTTPIFHR